METAEVRSEISGTGATYDGFMSYSHAADDLLAPRLQEGLQRFAKPWWKRRALRIFRDEASLSANPHLWSSITDALDQSGWFVLLLSPDAASSPWVNREVEYWLANKEPGRIIPVLTEGEFSWAGGDFSSDAAPPALQGAFLDEPRWVDLRFAHSEEQLDLGNPRFSEAVADIAAALRGVPKDELESEEVRQHRRFEEVLSLRFNSDGTKLLSGHRDGSVRIWDLATEELVLGFEGHAGSVWDASFSPDRSMVATASFDGTVRLWDAATGQELLLLEDSNAFTTARFSPDGKRLLVSGDFGARIYVIDVDDLIEVAQSRLLRWWTEDECFQFLQVSECPAPPVGLDF